MLRLLKRWLGWDSDSGPFDFSALRIGTRKSPFISQPPRQPQNRAPAAPRVEAGPRAPAPTQAAQAQPKGGVAKKPKKDRAPMDVLDNPHLTLDKPATGDGFDPYNTGAFNRSASWERIGRNKKR
jgi:hypothetical protein